MEVGSLKKFGRLVADRIAEAISVWTWPFLESFAEVCIVIIVGVAPFVLAVIRHNATSGKDADFDINTVFASSFSGGQLYLYAFSLLGTLLWLSIFKWTVPQRAYKWILGLIVTLAGFLIAALGGIDPTFSTINNTAIVRLSYYCYALFVVIYFMLLIGEKEKPPSARSTLRQEADALVDKLKALGDGND
ncbi:hypothetical protein GGD63_002974 [Bradyrhizobium sp. cir1]|uniref:hypothetical protein n=1 Tax=Bradyrhizobium sp. cir1 TaxID=1445730 RepID=UPI001605E3AA|nr:hypothetical protein [Bradyrhizobium sp. cir1]MBB4370181.1 hypothetical protein [Bradyrhizobium sp. cir1]